MPYNKKEDERKVFPFTHGLYCFNNKFISYFMIKNEWIGFDHTKSPSMTLFFYITKSFFDYELNLYGYFGNINGYDMVIYPDLFDSRKPFYYYCNNDYNCDNRDNRNTCDNRNTRRRIRFRRRHNSKKQTTRPVKTTSTTSTSNHKEIKIRDLSFDQEIDIPFSVRKKHFRADFNCIRSINQFRTVNTYVNTVFQYYSYLKFVHIKSRYQPDTPIFTTSFPIRWCVVKENKTKKTTKIIKNENIVFPIFVLYKRRKHRYFHYFTEIESEYDRHISHNKKVIETIKHLIIT